VTKVNVTSDDTIPMTVPSRRFLGSRGNCAGGGSRSQSRGRGSGGGGGSGGRGRGRGGG